MLEDVANQAVVIDCKTMEKLEIIWERLFDPAQEIPNGLPKITAPILKSLRLDGFPFMLPYIPPLLSTHPGLEVLNIVFGEEGVKEAVLEHARMRHSHRK